MIERRTKFISDILDKIDHVLIHGYVAFDMGLDKNIKKYFDSACIFARIFKSAAWVGQALKMI